jgi:hypothetical protein
MNLPSAGLHLVLLALLGVCVASAGGQRPPGEEEKKEAAAKAAVEKAAAKPLVIKGVAPAKAVFAQPVWTDENFDQWIFMDQRNASAARQRLDTQLALRIDYIDRSCGLTEEEKSKLHLAGRGDVKRFFDRYELVKRSFHEIKNDQQKFNQMWQEINPLQVAWQVGLFDEDSLFLKSLRHTLREDQFARYDAVARESRALHHRASIEMAVMVWEQSVPFRDRQRRELISLLTKETKPPLKSTSYDYNLIVYELSCLPQEKLKPLFDEAQWKIMNRYLAQGRGVAPFLRKNGLLGNEDNEGDRADAQAVPAKK